MSYILDALKKAESERKLGTVPNVHAQPVPVASADGRPTLWRRPLMWIVPLALMILLAAFASLRPWQTGSSPVQPLPEAAQAGSESGTAPQTAPVVAEPTPKISLPADAAPSHKSSPTKPAKPKSDRTLVKKPAESKPAPAAAPSENQVATLRELPENIQREIPALTVNGYIYSSIQSERSVLINKKLLHEGDEVVPGLMLEKMMPKEAVLNYKGYRYRMPY